MSEMSDTSSCCEVCGLPCVGSARFCDVHRREHARRIGEQIAAVRDRHARRLAAHEAAAAEGVTGWEGYFRGERIFAAREATRPHDQGGADS